ncbi:MAG TPA: peptide deformylase, partial [Acidimicrobiia bacterium]|nr:peptide deformylase [Acidimicrobiia bacterium]
MPEWTVGEIYRLAGARDTRLDSSTLPHSPKSGEITLAILPIRTFGDPVLRLETKTVLEVDESISALAVDMIETMYQAPGVGLAANQIGISRRIAVFDAQDGLGPRVMINPEIVEL